MPGHRVRILSTPSARPDTLACGLEPVTLLDAGAERALEAIANPPRPIGGNPWHLARQFHAVLGLLGDVRDSLDVLYADPAARPDLLIADFTLPVAGPVAQAHGIAWWTSLPSPCVLETRAGPPAYFGGLEPRDDAAGRTRDAAARLAIRVFKRGVARLERRRLAALGLPGAYRADGTEAAYSPDRILALGLESLELGRGFPAALRFVGPAPLTPPSAAPDPPFRAGRRHVLVTCGTHLARVKEALSAAAASVARALPDVDVHVSDGAGDVGPRPARRDAEGPANLVRLAWVDYARHVRRYALVVHHGGSGILYHCLAAGVPAVVLPFDHDQFDNAARLRHAGAALRARSCAELPALVARALEDGALAARCEGLAAEVRASGERRAVRRLVDAAATTAPER